MVVLIVNFLGPLENGHLLICINNELLMMRYSQYLQCREALFNFLPHNPLTTADFFCLFAHRQA